MSNPTLSVLMSVYNETCNDITEAIDSILNQTYCDFEFIIVDDNPARLEYKSLLAEYQKKDSRIVLLENEVNIGLAMSMNKAASYAKTDVFVRMDADDVSLANRLEQERRLLLDGNYDLVCGRYTTIDEKSQEVDVCDIKPHYISSKKIAETLPYKSVIHHPTVMMTREIFERVGGYRDFPCAQDFDLWLRMLEANATFAMTEQPVLKYRKRSTGVTATRRIKQRLTVEYIRDLYIERLKKGYDSFSKYHYEQYLLKNIKDEKKDSKLIEQGSIELVQANMFARQGKIFTSKVLKCKVLLCNRVYRHILIKLWFSKYQIQRLRIN